MTNKYEEELMKTDAFCLECAEETAQGVCDYFEVAYKPNGSSTPIAPTPTLPSSTTPCIKNTVNVTTFLNIRSKPNGTIVGRLQNGDEVNVLDYQSGWFKIDTDKWVSANYISNAKGIVTASVLNIRTGAGTSYKDIGDLKKNETVRICGEKDGWYMILTNNKVLGWASGKYIKIA